MLQDILVEERDVVDYFLDDDVLSIHVPRTIND